MPGKVLKFPPRAAPDLPTPDRTRDEFLADPWGGLRSSSGDIPPAWVGEAWAQRTFRKRATDSLVRSVQKNGDLYTSADLLRTLGQAGLRREAVVELYVAIRDRGEAAESEWRPDFEVAFADQVASLPPLDD